MNEQLDVRRHMDLFDPYKFGDTPIHVIGAGATGSWLVLQLAKLGLTNITVYDYDTVEGHNIPNQAFGKHHVGLPKVLALQSMVESDTGCRINIKEEKVVDQALSGYVFLMVDSMSARKEIWENCIKFKTTVKHLVEPRMGLSEARIYNVNPMEMKQIKAYEACWYPDDQAEVSACGTSQTVITTAIMTAAVCARQLINHFKGEELSNEMIFDCIYNQIHEFRW